MGQETSRRGWVCSIAAAAVVVLAGCGGGSARNIDQGIVVEGDGTKSIVRTLENRGSTTVRIRLSLDGDTLETVHIPAGDWHTVEIYNLYPDDVITFTADWDGGEATSGSFSQDGRTIFEDRSRAAGSRFQQREGRNWIDAGRPVQRIPAHRKA